MKRLKLLTQIFNKLSGRPMDDEEIVDGLADVMKGYGVDLDEKIATRDETYDPYATTVHSILKMFEGLSDRTDINGFLNTILTKCKDAIEYDTGSRPKIEEVKISKELYQDKLDLWKHFHANIPRLGGSDWMEEGPHKIIEAAEIEKTLEYIQMCLDSGNLVIMERFQYYFQPRGCSSVKL